jgi:hypothetical protein
LGAGSFRQADAGNSVWRTALYATAVFLAAFAALAWDIEANGIAAAYSDPIGKIRAQDESLYVNGAMRMAQDGDWLTPKFMGRLFFRKPPILFWLSAAAIRMFGLSLFAVRLPALLLGAAGIAAVFAWCAAARSITAGAIAAALLLMSPLWQIMSRLCYTDVLSSSFSALALLSIALDPRIERRRTRIVFGVCVAGAVLSKSLAGILPLAALAVYCLLLSRKDRPAVSSLLETIVVFVVAAAPWHVYQMLVHRQWFWADYVEWQLLGVGLHAEWNGVFNRSPLFYALRLIEMDPVLALFGAVGIVGTLRAWPLRDDPPKLLAAAWMAIAVVALCAFQAKNLPYIVFALPPLAILGALGSPAFLDRSPRIAVGLVALLFLVKGFADGKPWGLRPYAPLLEGASAMRAYCDLHRDAELIAVDPDDEFYSTTLPLPRVRYCFLDPSGSVARSVPYYPALGITLSAEQFIQLPSLLPKFEQRLRAWGLASPDEAIGSAITLRAPAQLIDIVRARPGSDFYVPSGWTGVLSQPLPAHRTFRYSARRVFLLSDRAGQLKWSASPVPARW